MAIRWHLPRFGVDADAVGRLIRGQLPDDGDELSNILDGPRYRLDKLLAQHTLAQSTLKRCRDEGRPFVLYLRSFGAEVRVEHAGSMVNADSFELQQAIAFQLKERAVPMLKLEGGSDGLFAAPTFPGASDTGVLATNADNWLEVAGELIAAASVTVLLVSHLSPGVKLEIERLRSRGLQGRCLIVLMDPQQTFNRDLADDLETLHAAFHDFPEVFELEAPNGSRRPSTDSARFRELLQQKTLEAGDLGALRTSLEIGCTYLDISYTQSADYTETERLLWAQLRYLRAALHDAYWSALKARDIDYGALRFDVERRRAHVAYGLAIATEDFAAIDESLRSLELVYAARKSRLAIDAAVLRAQYKKLAGSFAASARATEAQYTDHADPLAAKPSPALAWSFAEVASKVERAGDIDRCNYIHQVAIAILLSCEDRDLPQNKWALAGFLYDWAMFQTRIRYVQHAIVSHRFSLALRRELAATEPERLAEVALSLNNLGKLLFDVGDIEGCAAAFEESLAIRREQAASNDSYYADLGYSLYNLGSVASKRGESACAADYFKESVGAFEQGLARDPALRVMLLQARMMFGGSLVELPERGGELTETMIVIRAALTEVATIDPGAHRQLEAQLEELTKRVANGV